MDDKRARVTDIGEVGEHLQPFDEGLAALIATLQAEGEHRAGPLGRIFLLQRVVGIIGQRRIRDPGHFRMIFQPFRNGDALSQWRCILSGKVSMPVRIMKALKGEMAGPKSRRPSTRAAIAKGDVAEGRMQLDPPYSGRGSDSNRIFTRGRPVECAAINDDAAHRIAVAAHDLVNE